jgi:ABC-type uncharacterized transport system substrate-binding protein
VSACSGTPPMQTASGPITVACSRGLKSLAMAREKSSSFTASPTKSQRSFRAWRPSLWRDVLVGVGGAAPYVKKATSTIPMVFMYVADPIGTKLVESIRHPGGTT